MPQSLNIGGQAVIEGVMMRSPHAFTVAVRQGGRPDAGIAILKERLEPIGDRLPLLKKRFIRGAAALFEALWLGIRALNFSANETFESETGKKEEVGTLAMIGTLAGAVIFGLGLFLALPLLLTSLLGTKVEAVAESSVLFNLADGAMRAALFLGYVSSISLMKDIRRVFEYHGAEHKAISAWEAGEELTIENVRRQPKIHPRCGTSFLLVVIVLSIIMFSFIPGEWPVWAKGVSRLILLPVIAGIAYEFIRYSAKRRGRPIVEALILPGLWLQGLTTREPSDDQIEVAVRALKEALAMEPR